LKILLDTWVAYAKSDDVALFMNPVNLHGQYPKYDEMFPAEEQMYISKLRNINFETMDDFMTNGIEKMFANARKFTPNPKSQIATASKRLENSLLSLILKRGFGKKFPESFKVQEWLNKKNYHIQFEKTKPHKADKRKKKTKSKSSHKKRKMSDTESKSPPSKLPDTESPSSKLSDTESELSSLPTMHEENDVEYRPTETVDVRLHSNSPQFCDPKSPKTHVRRTQRVAELESKQKPLERRRSRGSFALPLRIAVPNMTNAMIMTENEVNSSGFIRELNFKSPVISSCPPTGKDQRSQSSCSSEPDLRNPHIFERYVCEKSPIISTPVFSRSSSWNSNMKLFNDAFGTVHDINQSVSPSISTSLSTSSIEENHGFSRDEISPVSSPSNSHSEEQSIERSSLKMDCRSRGAVLLRKTEPCYQSSLGEIDSKVQSSLGETESKVQPESTKPIQAQNALSFSGVQPHLASADLNKIKSKFLIEILTATDLVPLDRNWICKILLNSASTWDTDWPRISDSCTKLAACISMFRNKDKELTKKLIDMLLNQLKSNVSSPQLVTSLTSVILGEENMCYQICKLLCDFHT
jgi:hypothetical protein